MKVYSGRLQASALYAALTFDLGNDSSRECGSGRSHDNGQS